MGFELRATGGALDGLGQREQTRSSGEALQVSTTNVGRLRHKCHSPAKRLAVAQAYRPSLACQVQVPSKGVGKVKHCQGE